MQVEFDPEKDAVNLAKHGLSLARAAEIDLKGVPSSPDERAAYGERRWVAYATLDGRLHVFVYTWRGSACRAISLRRANRREVKRHA